MSVSNALTKYAWIIAAVAALVLASTLRGSVFFEGDGMNSPRVGGDPKILAIVDAIARAEGYGVPGQIPTVRFNPGDIMGSDGVIRTYGSEAEGYAALYSQVNRMVDGWRGLYGSQQTWMQWAQTYVGTSDAGNWARNVAAQLGVDVNSPVDEFLAS